MEAQKIKFFEGVAATVREIGEVLFNIHSDQQFYCIFGITTAQLKEVIQKVVDALPDPLFVNLTQNQLLEVQNICAREFVFFQVQEKWDDPLYQERLTMFIRIFSRDISQQMEKLQPRKTNSPINIKEE